MKQIEIAGIAFEPVKASSKIGQQITSTCLNDLWLKEFDRLYVKPSQTKKDIYRKWLNAIYNDMDGVIYGCRGNSDTFTIYGEVTTEQNERCYIMITKSHNRIVVEG